jgi:hypothetical protein
MRRLEGNWREQKDKNMNIEELLKDQVKGIKSDIYQADQAYALLCQIGQSAGQINICKFGGFFAPIQDILVRDYVLGITKVFDVPNKRYPMRSIPAMVTLLKKSANDLKICQKTNMLKKLSSAGMVVSEPLPDSDITLALIDHYNGKLPSKEKVDRTLDALKCKRDKDYVHNESIDPINFPETTWRETRELLELAKKFTDVISTGYLGLFLAVEDGPYLLGEDAKQPSRCLNRLLIKAGIIEKNETRPHGEGE